MSSIRDRAARQIIEDYQSQFRLGQLPMPGPTYFTTPGPIKVGIIGAGVAGLYAAMIIDSFGGGSGITYEVLEASDRVGGRLFTHRFSDSPNDYYDAGAMRFPKIPFMERTFHLLETLKMPLIPYTLSNPTNINFYNGKIFTNEGIKQAASSGQFDPFETGSGAFDTVDHMINHKIQGFRDAIVADFKKGWKLLMHFDRWSTRGYLALYGPRKRTYSDKLIDYLETFSTGTNLYDSALSETVMSSLDFDYPEHKVEWKCVQGGTEQIAQAMAKGLELGKVEKRKRVTAISPNTLSKTPSLNVGVDDEPIPRNYDHVISTMPLSCLRMVDTSNCQLPWDLQVALRALRYDASVKVAIKFKERWWESPKFNQIGGVSRTDRPVRVVVYPSYGIGGPDAAIIVSYTWAQDASRFGAFVKGQQSQDSKVQKPLLDVILKDLADMHGITDYGYLPSLMVDHHAWNWYADEYTAGAFALFGPGQFNKLYPMVTQPAMGRLHFAGEATSVRHGWVVGALNSAYRAVLEILVANGRDDLIDILKDKWKTVEEIDVKNLAYQVGLGQRTGPFAEQLK